MVAIAYVGVSADDQAFLALGIYLLLPVTAGFRYRLAGIIIATIIASLLVVSHSGWRARIQGDLESNTAIQCAGVWVALIAIMGALIWVLIRTSDKTRWEQAQSQEAERADHRRTIERLESQLFQYKQQYYGLSNRESDVLELLPTDLSYQQIGERLAISPNTVKSHVQRIAEKLNVPNKRNIIEAQAHNLDLIRWDKREPPEY